MADISAKDVMKLRSQTGLAMMACKKALQEADGDFEKAEEILRKQLKGKMEKRIDRAAGEGRIAIAVDDDHRAGAIVEFSAETDFTAKNESFIEATRRIAAQVLGAVAGAVSPTEDMSSVLEDLKISTGENLSIARLHKLEGDDKTVFGSYVHHDGKTAVLLQGEGDIPEDLARDICMHIAAYQPRPQGVTREDVPDSVIERERKLALEMAKEQGKPEEIAQKMVEGKINKLYSDLALMEQPFVKDPDKKISDLVPQGATLRTFLRWQVGIED